MILSSWNMKVKIGIIYEYATWVFDILGIIDSERDNAVFNILEC